MNIGLASINEKFQKNDRKQTHIYFMYFALTIVVNHIIVSLSVLTSNKHNTCQLITSMCMTIRIKSISTCITRFVHQ